MFAVPLTAKMINILLIALSGTRKTPNNLSSYKEPGHIDNIDILRLLPQ